MTVLSPDLSGLDVGDEVQHHQGVEQVSQLVVVIGESYGAELRTSVLDECDGPDDPARRRV